MKNKHFIFLMLTVVWLCQIYPQQSNNKSLKQLITQVSPSIVGIEATSRQGMSYKESFLSGKYYGTGFFIAPGLIVTTRESVQYQLELECTFADHTKGRARVVAYDPNSPLVLLLTKRDDFPPLSLDLSPQIGSFCLTAGNSYKSITRTFKVSYSVGAVSAIYDFTREQTTIKEVIETEAAINPGSYGGPLLNLSGEVWGVLFSGYKESRMAGLAVPALLLEEFFIRYQQGELVAPSDVFLLQSFPVYAGVRFSQPQKFSEVSYIEPNSPAQKAGLQRKDQIIRVAKQSIASGEHFYQVIQRYFPRQKIVVWVVRNEKILKLPLVLRARFM